MYRDISSPVPVLYHDKSKNAKLVALWYKGITVTSLAKQWFCSDKYYHKGIWCTQIFSSQLLRRCNKNQLFLFFGLLDDMLHRQDFPNNWFERRLKLSAMFPFIFRKVVSPSWFYCSNSEVTLKWLWKFFAISNLISCIWVESSVRRFFSNFCWKLKIIFISNCNEYFTFKKAWEEFCRNFVSYIRKSFELAVIKRL